MDLNIYVYSPQNETLSKVVVNLFIWEIENKKIFVFKKQSQGSEENPLMTSFLWEILSRYWKDLLLL